jgi:predicted kinase
MSIHFIEAQKFYILSGPSASGKSSLTRQLVSQGLPEDAIVSSDSMRKQILGSSFGTDEFGTKEILLGWEIRQKEIFKIIEDILALRFEQHLPTIFDATNLNDNERKPFVDLAEKYGLQSHIIIFDTAKEELERRLSGRLERFDLSVISRQLEIFQKDSAYPFSVANSEDQFVLMPQLLLTSKIDVVGDTHGLLDETVLLLQQKGWHYQNGCFFHPDPERKVLFLGDIIDRGLQSVPLWIAVKNTVNQSQGLFVMGNHEAKLMNAYTQYQETGLLRAKSLSNAQTLLEFLKLDKAEQKSLYDFLLKSPVQYALWVNKENGEVIHSGNYQADKDYDLFKMAFAHADNNYYHPYRFPRSHALYGQKKLNGFKDSDSEYEKHYMNGLNEYIYVRGHTPNASKQNTTYSLEDNQAFAGNLVLLSLDNYLPLLQKNKWEPEHQFFEDTIVKQKSEFNFDTLNKDTIDLMKGLNQLVKDGLATDGWRKDDSGVKQPHPEGFKIYKYSKKVHFKKLWKSHPLLEKARGIGLDIAGNIIVHPFDKLYNYGEYDTGKNVKHNQRVQVIEKLNGFLGCISKHPFKEELLLSTTGSFNSPFIQYIADFIDEPTKERLLKYFKNHNETLMFEVIHPEDKPSHIIEYDEAHNGLWLIGARERKSGANIKTESQVDEIGKILQLRRPFWYEADFHDVLNTLKSSQLEGFMIRDAQSHEPLMKIKTDYYLVTKFIGRMGPNNIEFMFKRPEQFKENKVEEEFYPIVDKIVKTVSQEDFTQMDQKLRVELVRQIVDDVREQVSHKSSLKP